MFRLTSSVRCHASGCSAVKCALSCSVPVWTIPAAWTSASSGPCAEPAAATTSNACSRSVRSATCALTTAPPARSADARSWTRAVVEVIATRAPNRASSRADAKPIPEALPQPVMSTLRPWKLKGSPDTGGIVSANPGDPQAVIPGTVARRGSDRAQASASCAGEAVQRNSTSPPTLRPLSATNRSQSRVICKQGEPRPDSVSSVMRTAPSYRQEAVIYAASATGSNELTPTEPGASLIHATSGAITAAASALTPRSVLEAKDRWYSGPM